MSMESFCNLHVGPSLLLSVGEKKHFVKKPELFLFVNTEIYKLPQTVFALSINSFVRHFTK